MIFYKSTFKKGLSACLIFLTSSLFFSHSVDAQCGFLPTCSSTDYLNFGMGSNTNATTLEYDNFLSGYHCTVVRTSSGNYKTWGQDMGNDGVADILTPMIINNANFPALTGNVLKAHLGSTGSSAAQGIVLATDGLYAWSAEGLILHANITSSTTFQKLTINGNTQGLPAGVAPTDVKMMFSTNQTLGIVTCTGNVWVITQQGENTGTGLTGVLSAAAAVQWYQVTESTGGNPVLSNVIQLRGQKNTLFALKSDGTLWTWGTETYLANGTGQASLNRATQMTLPSVNPIKMIGATRNNTGNVASYYVLNADGNMYSLGNNASNQLGDWTTTERRVWVQPRFTSTVGPIMNNIHWISPQEHDRNTPSVNIITTDSTNYNWGSAAGEMLGRGGTGNFNPGIPNGILITDKVLAVETGGHTSMLAKKCEDFFGYVGHRIGGSMGDGTATNVFETTYTFATAIVYICGASTATVEVSGTPTLSPGGLYCNGTSTDLLPSPAGGTLSILSGPATLAGNIITFNGTGNTTVVVQYSITVPGCPIAKVATTTLFTEDCVLPTVSLSGTTTIVENAVGVVTLTATLSAVSATPTIITLTYSGTTVGADYAASSVTITIPAGSLTGTVTIDPTDDVISEASETVIVDITSVSSASGVAENGSQQAIVTITDNDSPTVTLMGTTSIAENAAGVATLTAMLSNVATSVVTVTITYTGTAAGADYASSSVTIIIPAGSLTGTVTIDPTDDIIYEGSETVIADITSVTGGNGATESGTQTATVTITDDETIPTVTLSGTASIAENAAGVATLTATLSVATTAATNITITYTGTASGADYATSSVTIIIPAGSLSGTVTIDPTDDIIYEGSETVVADITSVTGGNGATESGTQTATVTITDDETIPTVTLSGTASIAENAAGVATLTATLSVATTTATTITITYTGTASGADYATSSVTIIIPAGSLSGTVTIDPTDDIIYEGSETVVADITSVTGGNGATESGTQTATVTITDDETIPTVTLSGTTSIAENAAGVATLTATLSVATTTATTITIAYSGTASGADYAASSVTITIPAGSLTGTVTIDPTDDIIFEGSETVIADITAVTGGNGATESGTQTATVTIVDVNNSPVANDNSVSTNEDVAVVIPSINTNDTDVDGTVIVGTIDLDPTTPGQQTTFTNAQGTWTLNTLTGDITFTPVLNYNGTVSIPYTIEDNSGAISNQALITITVIPVNDSPVVDNDVNATTEDNSTVGGDLTDAGDSDPEGTTLVVNTTPVSGPSNGSIIINSDGTYTYTPNSNFNGTDIITVTICDQGLPLPAVCVTQTLTITVSPVNDSPSQGNEFTSTTEDNGTAVITNVTANNIDPDGTTTSVTVIVSTSGGGTVTNNGNGTISYVPAANFNGVDTIIYTVCDQGLPLPAICLNDTLFVTVNAVNDSPSQGNEFTSTTEDNGTAVITNVTANNIDPDGTTTSVTAIVSISGGGTVTNNGNGTISYVPAANFDGVDTIIYTVCDQGLPLPALCVNDTLFVTVNAVNDSPIIDNEFHITDFGVSVSGDLTNLGDADIDGNLVVTVNPIINPTNGSITINSDGTYTYIPNLGFEGNDTIVVQICDDGSPLPAICVNDTIFITVSNCLSNPLLDCDNDGLTNDEEITAGTDPLNPDSDGDGVIDGTEVADGTNPTEPCDLLLASQTVVPNAAWGLLDCDTDGLTNDEEITAGTDPLNPDSDGDGVIDGTEVADGTNPTEPCDLLIASQTVVPNAVWGLLDCDTDGLTNDEEITAGTDPLNPDSDGDGVIDGTEVVDGTNPTEPCDLLIASQTVVPNAAWGLLDCDSDGLTNDEEIAAGTDPLNPDSDGDGVIDGTEVADGTNPTAPCDLLIASQTVVPNAAWGLLDCDTDGLTNDEEITAGTDPLNPDSDGDGVLDGTEVLDGTDPTEPCDLLIASQTVVPNAAWGLLDCDNDGINNGTEITNGSNPQDPCSPNSCNDIIDVPNAFTPDGDGINDALVITGIEQFPENTLVIFNRWGNIVFEAENYKNDWTGTTNAGIVLGGENLPTGTYYYLLDLKQEEQEIVKGFIYIQR